MTIKLLIILAFVPSMLGITTQNDPTGKNFKALVGQSCREMTDGGCMIYTYRILNFKPSFQAFFIMACTTQAIISCKSMF